MPIESEVGRGELPALPAESDRSCRAVQLAALADVLDQVVDGDSRLVLVGGEAGSGKTTLVDAF